MSAHPQAVSPMWHGPCQVARTVSSSTGRVTACANPELCRIWFLCYIHVFRCISCTCCFKVIKKCKVSILNHTSCNILFAKKCVICDNMFIWIREGKDLLLYAMGLNEGSTVTRPAASGLTPARLQIKGSVYWVLIKYCSYLTCDIITITVMNTK